MQMKFNEFLEFLVRIADISKFSTESSINLFKLDEKNNGSIIEQNNNDKLIILDSNKSNVLIEDKVFIIVDLFLRLTVGSKLNMRAIKPVI